MRSRLPWLFLVVVACGRGAGEGGGEGGRDRARASPATVAERGDALAAVRTARCLACHAAEGLDALLLAPPAAVPLQLAPAFFAGDTLQRYLEGHRLHGDDGKADAAALAAFVRSVAAPVTFASATVGPAAIADGQRRFHESACAACHPTAGIDGLARRTDHQHLASFLQAPAGRRPDLLHDFALDATTASALAAWLLREQVQGEAADAAPPGLAFECFELPVKSPSLPVLDGLAPTRTGTTERLDVSMRTRDDHFALRFTGQLLIPSSGEWTFTCGSDDCSWLWIDDQRIVTNADLSPHRRRSGTVQLAAGPHALRIVYTEAEGEQSLEVLWSGPGREQEPLPAAALTTRTVVLRAPGIEGEGAAADAAAADAALVGPGRAAYARHRCASCHELAAAPAAMSAARSWARLGGEPGGVSGGSACPHGDDGTAVHARARAVLTALPSPAVELDAALVQNRCHACHARDGRGGLLPEVRSQLVEVEDLGDEGRLPPDLTLVGQRLRPDWLEHVLRGDVRARPYVRARMPRLPPQLAATFVRLLTTIDREPGFDAEPAFTAGAVERGRALAGVAGKNCITCHSFAGRRAIGPQGMDLAIQHERLRPTAFRDWLLHPTTVRPGTRMPSLWYRGDAEDRADADALRIWSSLGRAAPVPPGMASAAGLALDPIDRPILHGAFLRGLSARCLAVGSPLRGHYAYDLEHARLAWLWRGAFVDASGTWSGRAGALLEPLGTDRVELDDLEFVDLDAKAGSQLAERRCIGQLRDAEGYPTFVLRIGTAQLEDQPRPRFADGGVEIVRTLRCVRGAVHIGLQPQSGAARVSVLGLAAEPRDLHAGEAVDVVYRW